MESATYSYFKPGLFILSVITLLCFGSCNHDDGLSFPVEKSFSDPSEEVIALQQAITSSGAGWNGVLENTDGRIFKLFANFSTSEGVTLYTDASSISASVAKASPYRVEVSHNANATLIFGKGSNLDLMGESIDKDFTLIKITNDSIRLTGTNFSSSLILYKALPDDGKNFTMRGIEKSITAIAAYAATAKYLSAAIAANRITQIAISTSSRGILFTYVENETLQYAGTNFYYTEKGIFLKKPLMIQGKVVQEIFQDDNTKNLFMQIDGARVDFVSTPLPVIPLHYMIGNDYPSLIEFPPNVDGIEQPGWSDQFLYVWDYDKTDLYNKKFWILLGLDLSMNVITNKMNLDFYYIDDNSKVATGRFPYSFTKSAVGIYTFTPLALGADINGANALAIQANVAKTLNTFNNNTFSLELFDATAELNTLLPQFKSVEDAKIYFTGRFLK